MTRIPIDLNAPIACTATVDEIPLRIEQVNHLRNCLRGLDRTSAGLRLHFDDAPSLRGHLERFVADEKGCCQFWGFEIIDAGNDLSLRWDGPADAQAFLDELERWFRSDEPLTALSGLL